VKEDLKEQIKNLVEGEVFDDKETLQKYSRDASLFEVMPKLVIWPKNTEDIKNLVKFVSKKKEEGNKKDIPEYKNLSITVRAAGSCMSGGSLNESIIIDVSKHLNSFGVDRDEMVAVVEPGVFYRDFEVETLKHGLILPCYTASKNLCALGGMIGNNSAGEKTLLYGKMENYVQELNLVLSDGNEYIFKPVSRIELMKKSQQNNIEGDVYLKIMDLVDKNRDLINRSKPNVSKNSAGYYLWNIEHDGLFDLTKLIVGSQGTLGIVTKAKIGLVKTKEKSGMFVIFMNSLENLGEVINTVLTHKPESLESYDDSTLKLAVHFFPEMIKLMKQNILKLLFNFIPEAFMVLTGGMPKLILLAEFAGNDQTEIQTKIEMLERDMKRFNLKTRITKDKDDTEKYWTIRRESFNLLRKHIKGKRTAPFIDDICIAPKHIKDFVPRLRKILDEAKLTYTIAGHAGNGNFHVIPLMDMTSEKNRALISTLSDKVYDLLQEYNGSITAEHNDGIVRTPYLNKMYPPEIIDLFNKTKVIFDPLNLFNPGKKVNGTVEYMEEHLAKT
jgi:FAD/FMN-containing dehydrogenase